MKHQDGYFKNRENQSIYTQNWLPDNPAKAVLLIIHGFSKFVNYIRNFELPKSRISFGLCSVFIKADLCT